MIHDFTYIIKCQDYYKIGRARNVNRRLDTLQIGNPILLELIRVIPGGHYESRLHLIFRHKRIRGEWFKLTAEDLKIEQSELYKPIKIGKEEYLSNKKDEE